jgi:hypothetical protein
MTTYYIRTYATNESGTSYGNTITIETSGAIWYFRAYATNEAGTSYGENKTITVGTSPTEPPQILGQYPDPPNKKLLITLYDNNLVTPVEIANLQEEVQGLTFSTKLPGGYALCSFSLKESIGMMQEWTFKRFLSRIVIRSGNDDKTLFEGRLEDPEMSLDKETLTFYGYYSSLKDDIYTTAYNDTSDAVIKAVLTAKCPQISGDQSHIDALDTARNSADGEAYLDITPQEIATYLLDMSDTTKNKFYIAIWEDRKCWVFDRDDSAVNWYVSLEDIKSINLSPRISDLWNSCYAIYRVSGVLTRTDVASDTTSIAKCGITRTYAIPDLGEVSLAEAEGVRDAWIEEHKDIYSSSTSIVLGDLVYDSKGLASPSSFVRAGEVIQIIDLLPATSDLTNVRRNGLNTFYIMETQFNLDDYTNTLTLDNESQSLEAILARELKS